MVRKILYCTKITIIFKNSSLEIEKQNLEMKICFSKKKQNNLLFTKLKKVCYPKEKKSLI